MSLPNHFDLIATDGTARTGRLTTPHGVVRTPAFMPVGTAGAMKGMHWREVRDAGADIVLGNTYHLMLRPGAERIAALEKEKGRIEAALADPASFTDRAAMEEPSHRHGALVEEIAAAEEHWLTLAERAEAIAKN